MYRIRETKSQAELKKAKLEAVNKAWDNVIDANGMLHNCLHQVELVAALIDSPDQIQEIININKLEQKRLYESPWVQPFVHEFISKVLIAVGYFQQRNTDPDEMVQDGQVTRSNAGDDFLPMMNHFARRLEKMYKTHNITTLAHEGVYWVVQLSRLLVTYFTNLDRPIALVSVSPKPKIEMMDWAGTRHYNQHVDPIIYSIAKRYMPGVACMRDLDMTLGRLATSFWEGYILIEELNLKIANSHISTEKAEAGAHIKGLEELTIVKRSYDEYLKAIFLIDCDHLLDSN